MNPFHYGSPVSGERFTDRRPELTALLACMTQGQNAVVLSPRRYGKTSLLKRAVEDVRAQSGRAAMVSLIGCSSRRQMAQALATAVAVFNQRLLQGFSPEEHALLLHQLARIRANARSALGETAPLDAASDLVSASGPSASEQEIGE